jgi:hypothetical protein
MALGAGVAADECERRSVRAENTTFGDPLAYAERLARVTPDDPTSTLNARADEVIE